jgi:hypothetical protein
VRWSALGLLLAAGCPFDAGGVETASSDVGVGSSSEGSTSGTTTEDPTTSGVVMEDSGPTPESSGELPTTDVDPSATEGGSSSTSTRGVPGPACPDLLWIAGDLDPSVTTDGPYHAKLVELGYEIEMVLDAEAMPADAADKCAVILSSVGTADLIDQGFRELDRPLITWEPNLFDILGFVGTDNVGTYEGTDIEIVMSEHPLAMGHDGAVTIHVGTGLIGWGLAPGESIVASVPGVPSQAAIIAFETDAPMPGIANAPARRVGLPFHNAVDATPTDAALQLLAGAVRWATE